MVPVWYWEGATYLELFGKESISLNSFKSHLTKQFWLIKCKLKWIID